MKEFTFPASGHRGQRREHRTGDESITLQGLGSSGQGAPKIPALELLPGALRAQDTSSELCKGLQVLWGSAELSLQPELDSDQDH